MNPQNDVCEGGHYLEGEKATLVVFFDWWFVGIWGLAQQGIRESVDSLCRDGTDTPIVCVH